MLPIYLIKRILQEFLSSIDDPYMVLDLYVSIERFSLVCKEWRTSVVPQLSFESPINSVLRDQLDHRINELLNIGFRNFNVKSSNIDFGMLKKADQEEERKSKGEERVQKKKRFDQLKAFRDNTTIMSVNLDNPVISQENINDYIDPRRLKMLDFVKFDVGSSQAFNVDEYFGKNSFPELRDLKIQDIGIGLVDWSFPTMPQLESLYISFINLSGDELDIIFSRVKVITISGTHNIQAMILSHLERSTVVSHFTMIESSDHQVEQIFQQLVRLLNSNNTLKSLDIESDQLEDLGLHNDLPSIHNTTLEYLGLICHLDHNLRDPITQFFSKWTGSNLKTLNIPYRICSNFTSEFAHQIQSSFPKLKKISFHDGDIDAFKSYILSNHNLKTIKFGMDIHLNSSIIGCLHSIQNLIFYNLSVDLLIEILSIQSPSLKSLSVMYPLDSPSFLEISESLALSIRDNQHLTHLSFTIPTSGFSDDTQLIKFLTSIIEGNRSLLSLEIGYTLLKETSPLDSTQSNLFKQSILSNHTIRRLKIHRISKYIREDPSPAIAALIDFVKSQSIRTN